MPNRFQNKSFTLIEMLVVVVIIGILAGVLVPRLVGARERASDAARIVKVGQISSAVELYAQEQGSKYPLAVLTGAPGISIATPIVTDAISPYLTNIPTDPGKGTVAISGFAGNIQVTGDSFAYWTNDAGTVYAITALMESKKGNTTNATQIIDSDKQGGYQKVGKGLTTSIAPAGGGTVDTKVPGVYFAGGHTIVSDGTNVYTMMDKNLGASEVGTGPASYGYYYQRGNNFGFWNGLAGYTNQDGGGSITTSSTLVINPQPGYNSGIYILSDSNSQWDWKTPHSNNLRPEGSQGPCPNGYHIPSYSERVGLKNVRGSLSGKIISDGVLFSNDLKLPRAGLRDLDRGNRWQGEYGGYWSSTSDDAWATALAIDIGYLNPNDYFNHAIGVAIRCFKN